VSRARLLLHLAACVLPVLAVAGIRLADPSFERNVFQLTVAATVAAQVTLACGGASWLLRCASIPWGAPLAGLGLGLVTHALFGPFLALTFWVAGEFLDADDLFIGGPVMSLVAAFLVGWISLPATMATGALVGRVHRRELARAAA